MTGFYELSAARDHGCLQLEGWDGQFDFWGLVRGDAVIDRLLKIRRKVGSGIRHIMGAGGSDLYVISQDVRDALTAHAITGWKTYATEIRLSRTETLGNYAMLAITGRCGPLDFWRGDQVKRPNYRPGKPPVTYQRGLWFDIASWDGSDLVLPGERAHILCTERVRMALAPFTGKNLTFTPLPDVELEPMVV